MVYSTLRSYLRSSLLVSLGKIASVCKVSYILGSRTLFFSLNQCITPLTGRYATVTTLGLVYLIKAGTLWVLGSPWYYSLLYHIPTICGALTFKWLSPYGMQPHKTARFFVVGILLAAIGLFGAHPIGSQAALYTLPWLVALALTLSAHISRTVGGAALISTLTSHAVGSVFWLYASTLTAHDWLALLPISCLERLLFAAGMVTLASLYEYALTYHFMRALARAEIL